MNDIFRLMQYKYMVPILIAFVVMIVLSMILAARKGKEARLRLYLSRSLLILYGCVFIVVTQLLISKPSGWGIVFEPNLIPFKMLIQNYNYHGSEALQQFFLNITMCIPLGILLPVSFPRKKWGYAKAMVIAIAVPFLTELIQLFTGRIADVDDLIANGIGVIIGFGFIMALWHFSRARRFRLANGWLVFVSVVCMLIVIGMILYVIYWFALMIYVRLTLQ